MSKTSAIVAVGAGRGFLVEKQNGERLVITAAHCLPFLPPSHPGSYPQERTYANLVGLVGGSGTIWVECLFVDPVSDIAVLGTSDDQLFDESDAFDAFVEAQPAFPLAAPPTVSIPVALMDLAGEWVPCTARLQGERSLAVEGPIHAYAPGTSGSPIVNEDGAAVGLVSCGSYLNPALARCLPVWVWEHLRPSEGINDSRQRGASGSARR
jgi:hypothetical protein